MADENQLDLIKLSKEQHQEVISKIEDLIYIMNQALRMILITIGLIMGFGVIAVGAIITILIIYYR
jgi:hypothetical protein